MVTITILSILLTLNMILMHGHTFVQFYYWMYKKAKKPKFKINEYVMINDTEFEIIMITNNAKPYTYFCLPVKATGVRMIEAYYHESRIKKKTGLLKELE